MNVPEMGSAVKMKFARTRTGHISAVRIPETSSPVPRD